MYPNAYLRSWHEWRGIKHPSIPTPYGNHDIAHTKGNAPVLRDIETVSVEKVKGLNLGVFSGEAVALEESRGTSTTPRRCKHINFS